MKIVLNKEQSRIFIECLMPAIRKLAREEKQKRLEMLKQTQQQQTKVARAGAS